MNNSQYGDGSIRVLKGLEPVKERPGMYTRTQDPTHIIQEVIDNSADEALGGYARKIEVTLHEDGSVSVEDDGRGIPCGIHPDEGEPTVQLVFTRLHAGGKFDKKSGQGAYAFSGGVARGRRIRHQRPVKASGGDCQAGRQGSFHDLRRWVRHRAPGGPGNLRGA
nr:ATP-binding protein [Ferrovum sp.]